MNAEQLLAHYERVADVPDAVERLRQLVLELAVRGKLVAQDASEREPARSLVVARAWLAEKAGKTGRVRWKPSEEIGAGDLAERLPPGWVAARINDTGLYINGLAFKPTDWKLAGLPIIRIQNLTDPSKEFNFAQGEFPDEVIVRTGDILVSWSATLDAFRWTRGTGVLNQHIFRVIPSPGLTSDAYLLLLLRNAIREMASGEHAHGLVMTHINRGPFTAHVVCIPPLAEQHRIVAKVDELMALCDRLEASRAQREATRARLSASTLARLNTFVPLASTDGDVPKESRFQSDASFAVDIFPALTARRDQIEQLRKTVLNLAVRGLLTRRVPTDAPASSLVQQIVRGTPPIAKAAGTSTGGVGWTTPDHWELVTLGQLTVAGPQNGLSPKQTSRLDAPRAVTLTATTSGEFNADHFKHVEVTLPADSDLWLRDGDLLFQRGNTREYVGMAAIYRGPPKTYLFPDLMIRVRISACVNLRYVHLAAISPPARKYFSDNATGAQLTMPKINQAVLVALPIPLPPRSEQDRIVAKVDELMSLCDQLEASLSRRDSTRSRLLNALLHEVLSPQGRPLLEAA